MKNTTKSFLNASAKNIAWHIAPSVVLGLKSDPKSNASLFDEIRSTITCKFNRRFVNADIVTLKLDNICKTKCQLDYLTEATVDELHRLGIAD